MRGWFSRWSCQGRNFWHQTNSMKTSSLLCSFMFSLSAEFVNKQGDWPPGGATFHHISTQQLNHYVSPHWQDRVHERNKQTTSMTNTHKSWHRCDVPGLGCSSSCVRAVRSSTSRHIASVLCGNRNATLTWFCQMTICTSSVTSSTGFFLWPLT